MRYVPFSKLELLDIHLLQSYLLPFAYRIAPFVAPLAVSSSSFPAGDAASSA
jgi:hypothetical protein